MPLHVSATGKNIVLKAKVSSSTTSKKDIETKFYNKAKADLDNSKYQVYRITERIIRANKLDDNAWRIAFNIDPTSLNASSSAVNLIKIDSGLFDSLNGDISALAFIIGHEISHSRLEHLKQNNYQLIEINNCITTNKNRIEQIDVELEAIYRKKKQLTYAASSSGLGGAIYCAFAQSNLNKQIESLNLELNGITTSTANSKQNYSNLLIQQEYEADRVAMELLIRAGFDPQGAIRTFKLLDKVPTIDEVNSTHPPIQERLSYIESFLSGLNIESITAEGKTNIKNSSYLNYDKSIDNQSLVIKSRLTSNNNDVNKSFDKLFDN